MRAITVQALCASARHLAHINGAEAHELSFQHASEIVHREPGSTLCAVKVKIDTRMFIGGTRQIEWPGTYQIRQN
jgi:hypothetical protein